MKYLVLALVLASIAGVEFFHALADDHLGDAGVCTASEARGEMVRDMLLAHLKNH